MLGDITGVVFLLAPFVLLLAGASGFWRKGKKGAGAALVLFSGVILLFTCIACDQLGPSSLLIEVPVVRVVVKPINQLILFGGFGAILGVGLLIADATTRLPVGRGLLGGLVGGTLGFLLRPAIPLVGQLPAGTVITRGAYLEGMDQLLTGIARASFNLVFGGVVVGAVAGAMIAYFLGQRRKCTNTLGTYSSEPSKSCPFCAETIKAAAKVCRFCGRDLPGP
ncbi:MAG: hypothetical protein ABSA52_22485 [Candidatus Binatia bacterium]